MGRLRFDLATKEHLMGMVFFEGIGLELTDLAIRGKHYWKKHEIRECKPTEITCATSTEV